MHRTITMPNGARILTEYIPGARTAAIGFYIGTGSRHERRAENGAAHFIEHMMFKGTAKRTAGQLACEMDALGGQVNAYTTKEMTCYYARCLDSHLDRCLELLCDMIFHSRFDQQDVELERGVILEEIDMYEDTPEDLVSERLSAAVYKGSALGRPILGKAATLEKMSGDWLREYHRTHYVPGSIVVSLAGNFTQKTVDELKSRLSALNCGPVIGEKPAIYTPAVTLRRKAIEQNHVILAFPAMGYRDPRRYQMLLLNTILGGGVSSRLFQQLREQRGLCYSVYSYCADHAETGLLGIYTALNKEQEPRALEAIRREVCDLAEHGPTQEELERTREQAKANVLMGLESVQARMSHLGTSTLLYGQVREVDQILQEYDRVTQEELRILAGEIFDFDRASLSAVGRGGSAEEYARLLPISLKHESIK